MDHEDPRKVMGALFIIGASAIAAVAVLPALDYLLKKVNLVKS